MSIHLRELKDAGITESRKATHGNGKEYFLTEAAQKLYTQKFTKEAMDQPLFMWNVRRRGDGSNLPEVWIGRRDLGNPLKFCGKRLEDSSAQLETFPRWFLLNAFAPAGLSVAA